MTIDESTVTRLDPEPDVILSRDGITAMRKQLFHELRLIPLNTFSLAFIMSLGLLACSSDAESGPVDGSGGVAAAPGSNGVGATNATGATNEGLGGANALGGATARGGQTTVAGDPSAGGASAGSAASSLGGSDLQSGGAGPFGTTGSGGSTSAGGISADGTVAGGSMGATATSAGGASGGSDTAAAGGVTTTSKTNSSAGNSNLGGSSNIGGTTASAGSNGAADWQLDPAPCLSKTEPGYPKQSHPLKPSAQWSSNLTGPKPTNAFWMNLVLGNGTQRINVLPYQVKALSNGLSVSSPPLTVAENAVTTADRTDVQLGATESFSRREVSAFDDLSVTVTWAATNGSIVTPIVYGMPYATGLYSGLTPSIKVPSAAITRVNGGTATPVTGQKLVLTLNNGQTWNLYASSSMSWTWSSAEIHATQPLTGSVRLAVVPQATDASILDEYAGAIPTSGEVQLSRTGDDAEVRFVWQRQGDGKLLMMALPHHLPRLIAADKQPLTYSSLSGTLTAVRGDAWSLKYPLSKIQWNAPRAPSSNLTADIKAALQADASYVPTAQDPYFGGKQIAKLARLALMASELGETSLSSTFLNNLRSRLSAWLDGTNAQPLVYDSTWGGIVSAAGIKASDADFGQGYYNDHHFHYGYHVYAAAVVARADASWASSYRDKALWLVRDIANPCRSDPYFPRFRNFDWFVGHSWAAGLFEFGDNRNQESSSEAVNAWYGVELLGRALDDTDLTNVGAILRAVETASAQTYWQVTSASDIYPAPFKSHHVVGVLWSTKVDFGTFFGANPEYIYGIQMLPFTPATEDLLNPTWVSDSWSQLSAAASGTTEVGWKGFMYMAHGVIAKDAAISEVKGLTGYDDGNSQANALYWAATRP